MTKLLVIDTETGGLDPEKHSIIQFGAVVWEDGKLGDSIEFYIVELPKIIADESALKINNISLDHVYKTGELVGTAIDKIQEFVAKNFPEGEPVALVGHNVAFDVAFTKRLYKRINKMELFNKTFSHRLLDTAGIVRFLSLSGKLQLTSASSDAAFKHFGIEPDPNERHTALADAKATGQLLTSLLLECQK
jgi:DNA polymerase III epsilon subunit-like protein